ncbi:MAG: sigma-70 family RNA polymerase sigma factor [Defluviitaleaceae bacterium]|nr:sigma-70 family RNA polymerase sigma factor [Defluviitaleaceae bacterium]
MTSDFIALADASYAKVFYHCLKQVKNDHDAADITQDTFFKAFVRFDTLRDISSFEPWLFIICNNEIKQFFRHGKKAVVMDESALQNQIAPPPTDEDDGYDALYDAIGSLSGVQRQVVLLKYFGGYTMQEMATVLSTSPITVKSRLHEARKTLKRLLDMPALSPSLQKERRHNLMSTLNLCEIGAKTIPSLSLYAQKQLLACAKDNVKFNPAILAELANTPTGQAFMEACGGKLSYEELVRVLACCDDATLYRLSDRPFYTWRNAVGNPLFGDIAALQGSGGYIDSVETILYVPSLPDTCKWYKKYLNWETDSDVADMEKWGHATIRPYVNGEFNDMSQQFKGFHLRPSSGGAITNTGCFVFVSGLEALRDGIVERGLDAVSDICHNGWGTKTFSVTDLNGFHIEFCEWEC